MKPIAASLLAMALLGGCASESDEALEAVKSARSVMAEWALVEKQGAKGQARSTYVEAMRKQARAQLEDAATRLRQTHPQPAALIDSIATGPPDVAGLAAADDALRPLERALEHP